ncbi:hypothetical protein [Actinacidiphila sp. bgisy167]|uniref:hypothetical protein n=1 Tax=Actinacidiphila sp. bgisy167 TaxID=3413797 RepID=UPI003D712F66
MRERLEAQLAECMSARRSLVTTRDRLAALAVTATSVDQSVEVVLGTQSGVTDIRFLNDMPRRMTGLQLAASVTEALNLAQQEFHARFTAITGASEDLTVTSGLDAARDESVVSGATVQDSAAHPQNLVSNPPDLLNEPHAPLYEGLSLAKEAHTSLEEPLTTPPESRSTRSQLRTVPREAEPIPVERFLDDVRMAHDASGDPLAMWIPRSAHQVDAGDAQSLTVLRQLAETHASFYVFGEVQGDGFVSGDRMVSPAALAAALQSPVAAGRTPVLMMPDGDRLAPVLAAELGGPVEASRYGGFVDRRHRVVRPGPLPETDLEDAEDPPATFRVFTPGLPEGTPVADRGLQPGTSVLPPLLAHLEGLGTEGTDALVPDTIVDLERSGTEDLTPGPSVPEVLELDPLIRSIGVPRAALPNTGAVVATLRDILGDRAGEVSDLDWDRLPHRLFSNYRYLVPGEPSAAPGEQGHDVTGLQVPLGPAEVLFTLDAVEPRLVERSSGSYDRPSTLETIPEELPHIEGVTPAGRTGAAASPGQEEPFVVKGTINASYLTGSGSQDHSGTTGATRGAIFLSFGVGTPVPVFNVFRGGVGVSGVANSFSRRSGVSDFTEGGHVEDNRGAATLLSYRPRWSMRVRTNVAQRWEEIAPTVVAQDRITESLMLVVPNHYLQKAPAQVRIDQRAAGDDAHRLPSTYFASGLTNIPVLFDAVTGALESQGVVLRMGSTERNELLQRIQKLDAHLDDAINNSGGYPFRLRDKYGRTIATVSVRARRMDGDAEPARRVGATDKQAHIENVRTAVTVTGGSQSISHSSSVQVTPAEFSLVPSQLHPDLGLGVGLNADMTWSSEDSLRADRSGLAVLVPRSAVPTGTHALRTSYVAVTSVPGQESVETPVVVSRALVRTTEGLAYKHQLTIDSEAVPALPRTKSAPGLPDVVPYEPASLRDVRRAPDRVRTPPSYVTEGKGIGMGLVDVADDTVRQIKSWIERELTRRGFLPASEREPMRGRGWWSHGNMFEAQMDNRERLDNVISRRGLEAHFDQLHQDGVTFTLRLPTGTMGVDVDVDAAKITVTAGKAEDKPPRHVGSTDEYHLVNLSMSGGGVSFGSAGSRRIGIGATFKGIARQLRGGATGGGVWREVGAGQEVGTFTNRPELLEYSGTSEVFEVTSSYSVTIEYEHSSLAGRLSTPPRRPARAHFPDQVATAHLLPIDHQSYEDPATVRTTPPQTLANAVVYYLDSTGLRPAVAGILPDMTGPNGTADLEISALTSGVLARAHVKEMANNQQHDDSFFDSRFLGRSVFGQVAMNMTMGPSRFEAATTSEFVRGIIKLGLTSVGTSERSSAGVSWTTLDVSVGDALASHPGVSLQGGVSGSRRWQGNRNSSDVRTAGKELIQLDFNRAYVFSTTVTFHVRGSEEKHGKLLPSSRRRGSADVPGRTMLYLLSEPEALLQYADKIVPLPEDQLKSVLRRWKDHELRLSGSTMAGVLVRWKEQSAADAPVLTDIRDAARILARLHSEGASPILDAARRHRFNAVFEHDLHDPRRPGDPVRLPEYLLTGNPDGNIFGHSGVHSLTYKGGDSTYEIVRRTVERTAPGLLSSSPEVRTEDGRLIGRLQLGVNALQAMFADGRDQALWEDMISGNGHRLFLVNPIGWLLADVVEIHLQDRLTSAPEVRDFVPATGLENYTHEYAAKSRGTSRDGGLGFTVGKLNAAGQHPSGGASLAFTESHHRGVNESDSEISERTVYSWDGHYLVAYQHELTVTTRRINMAGRWLNNKLAELYRKRDPQRSIPQQTVVSGSLVLQVPKGLGEFEAPVPGPRRARDLTPLPALPPDTHIAGGLLDRALPIVMDMFVKAYGSEASGEAVRTSPVLRPLFSREHLPKHVIETASREGTYELLRGAFIPGHSSDRFDLRLRGDLYNLEVLGPIAGTGPGSYHKHQSGTSAFASSNRWEATVALTGGAAGNVHTTDPAISLNGSPASTGTRGNSHNIGASLAQNARREQHVKMLGPSSLVRVQGKFRAQLVKYHKHLMGSGSKLKGTFLSDPITGDLYLTMHQGEIEELRARIDRRRRELDHTETPWPLLERAPVVNLTPLVISAGRRGDVEPHRLYRHVARALPGTLQSPAHALVLRYDPAAMAVEAFRDTVTWALRMVSPDAGADGIPTATQARWTQWSADFPAIPAEVQDVPAAVHDIVREVNTILERRNADAGKPLRPVEMPATVAYLNLEPAYLARDLAHELDVPVRLDVQVPTGGSRQYWITRTGRVHDFDPTTFDETSLTVDMAADAGLLSPETRAAAEVYGLGQEDMVRIYRTSWNDLYDFSTAVVAELGQRRHTLHTLDERLPELIDSAHEQARRWRSHQEQVDALRPEANRRARDAVLDLRRVSTGEDTETARMRRAFEEDRRARAYTTALNTRYEEAGRLKRLAETQLSELRALARGTGNVAASTAPGFTIDAAVAVINDLRANTLDQERIHLAPVAESGLREAEEEKPDRSPLERDPAAGSLEGTREQPSIPEVRIDDTRPGRRQEDRQRRFLEAPPAFLNEPRSTLREGRTSPYLASAAAGLETSMTGTSVRDTSVRDTSARVTSVRDTSARVTTALDTTESVFLPDQAGAEVLTPTPREDDTVIVPDAVVDWGTASNPLPLWELLGVDEPTHADYPRRLAHPTVAAEALVTGIRGRLPEATLSDPASVIHVKVHSTPVHMIPAAIQAVQAGVASLRRSLHIQMSADANSAVQVCPPTMSS